MEKHSITKQPAVTHSTHQLPKEMQTNITHLPLEFEIHPQIKTGHLTPHRHFSGISV